MPFKPSSSSFCMSFTTFRSFSSGLKISANAFWLFDGFVSGSNFSSAVSVVRNLSSTGLSSFEFASPTFFLPIRTPSTRRVPLHAVHLSMPFCLHAPHFVSAPSMFMKPNELHSPQTYHELPEQYGHASSTRGSGSLPFPPHGRHGARFVMSHSRQIGSLLSLQWSQTWPFMPLQWSHVTSNGFHWRRPAESTSHSRLKSGGGIFGRTVCAAANDASTESRARPRTASGDQIFFIGCLQADSRDSIDAAP